MVMFKWRALGVVVAMSLCSYWVSPAPPASAAPVPPAWQSALDGLSGTVVSSDTTADAASIAVSSTAFNGLPRTGSNYLLMSTGDVGQAFGDPGTFTSTDLAGAPGGVDANDLTQLRLTLVPPTGATCMAFDFFFASEEYPEFVGTKYNDTFTAELNQSEWFLDSTQLVAPNNFAFDPDGNAISINTVIGLNPLAGTTMDGTTPPLTAVTPVERRPADGLMELILSVQDLGDSIYDSIVALDNLRWLYGPNCERGTSPLTDSDGDELSDDWETNGIDYDNDGTPELDLPAMGADPQHKDLFLETDWMFQAPTCNGAVCFGGQDFAPLPDALADVRAAFAAAPLTNPDGQSGVRVHIDAGPGSVMNPVTGATWGNRSRGTAIAHDPVIGSFIKDADGNIISYVWDEFNTVKQANFEPFRRDAFHYVVYANQYGESGYTSSGISRGIPGSDLLVTDGGWNGSAGFTRTQERGTFMHELGHGLGLGHGGADGSNYKPNYFSIMSYNYQLTGLMPGSDLSYSRSALSPLNEAALSEAAGLDPDGLATGLTFWWCGATNRTTSAPATNVDWNCSGGINPGTVSANVNGDVDGTPAHNPIIGTLNGSADWPLVRFDGGSVGDLGDALPLPAETEVETLDPDLAKEINALAPAGDGTVEVVGPTMLLAGTGDQNVVFDVTNSSEANGNYRVDVESDLPFTATSGTVAVAAEKTGRVRLPVDTDGLAPGDYPVTAILSKVGGGELHRQEGVITVPDLGDPAVRAEVAATVDEISQMPDDSGLDPEVRDEIVAMAAEAGIGHETVELTITPTGAGGGSPIVVRGPISSGSVNVSPSLLSGRPTVNGQGTIATASGPATFRITHTPLLLGLSLGYLEVRAPNGVLYQAPTPLGPPSNLGSDGASGTFQGSRPGTGTFRIAYEVRDRP